MFWRTYRQAPNAAPREADLRIAVRDAQIVGMVGPGWPPLELRHDSQAEAVASLHAWEARVLASGGAITAIALERALARPSRK